jgi:hypothetical protein
VFLPFLPMLPTQILLNNLAPMLGFTVPPPVYFVFLVLTTATYLALVQFVKRAVVARIMSPGLGRSV